MLSARVIDAERDDDALLADGDAGRSSASRAVARQALSCAAVFATNRRLAARWLAPRVAMVDGSGSRLRAY